MDLNFIQTLTNFLFPSETKCLYSLFKPSVKCKLEFVIVENILYTHFKLFFSWNVEKLLLSKTKTTFAFIEKHINASRYWSFKVWSYCIIFMIKETEWFFHIFETKVIFSSISYPVWCFILGVKCKKDDIDLRLCTSEYYGYVLNIYRGILSESSRIGTALLYLLFPIINRLRQKCRHSIEKRI